MKLTFLTTLSILFLTSPAMAGGVLPKDAQLKAETRVAFTEGPVWHPSGNVYFSDIANNRIVRLDRKGQLHIFRTPSGYTNGNLFDLEGRLLSCEGGGIDSNRRITRTEKDGTITILTDNYQGKPYNSPNDLTIDSKGRIYFTDPRYRDRTGMQQLDKNGKPIEGVYRIDGVGKVTRIINHEVDRPNGIAVSPNGKFLYVADNVNDGPNNGVGGNRKLWRFDLKSDGTVDLKSQKLMFDWGTDRGPDGMAVDIKGNLYVSAGFNFPKLPAETSKKYKSGIYIISPEGKLLDTILVPADMITNCAFGGPDRKTLYITAGHKLWSIRTATPGFLAWPSKGPQ